jgi:hypothetical protein
MTREEKQNEIGFFKTWTKNGTKLITSVGGSAFHIAGGNRKRGAVIHPDRMNALIKAGVLRRVAGGFMFETGTV